MMKVEEGAARERIRTLVPTGEGYQLADSLANGRPTVSGGPGSEYRRIFNPASAAARYIAL
jgi:hypothetical protein